MGENAVAFLFWTAKCRPSFFVPSGGKHTPRCQRGNALLIHCVSLVLLKNSVGCGIILLEAELTAKLQENTKSVTTKCRFTFFQTCDRIISTKNSRSTMAHSISRTITELRKENAEVKMHVYFIWIFRSSIILSGFGRVAVGV